MTSLSVPGSNLPAISTLAYIPSATNSFAPSPPQAPQTSPVAYKPSATLMRQVMSNGKSQTVNFTSVGNTIKLSTAEGIPLGEGAASEIAPLLATGDAIEAGALLTTAFIFTAAFLTAFFSFTPDLAKQPNLIPNGKIDSLDAFVAATNLAGLNFNGHPEALGKLRRALGKNLKPFIMRASGLALEVKKGQVKPDSATAILRAELEVMLMKKGNGLDRQVRIPQKTEPNRVNTPNGDKLPSLKPKNSTTNSRRPVLPVSKLPVVTVGKEVLPVLALPIRSSVTKTAQKPHTSIQDTPRFLQDLKRLYQIIPHHVFKGETAADLAKETGIAENEIHREMEKGESPRDAVNRILAVKFSPGTGAADTSFSYTSAGINNTLKNIRWSSIKQVRTWLETMSTQQRAELPLEIKHALYEKLKYYSMISSLRVRIDNLAANHQNATHLIKSILRHILEEPGFTSDMQRFLKSGIPIVIRNIDDLASHTNSGRQPISIDLRPDIIERIVNNASSHVGRDIAVLSEYICHELFHNNATITDNQTLRPTITRQDLQNLGFSREQAHEYLGEILYENKMREEYLAHRKQFLFAARNNPLFDVNNPIYQVIKNNMTGPINSDALRAFSAILDGKGYKKAIAAKAEIEFERLWPKPRGR